MKRYYMDDPASGMSRDDEHGDWVRAEDAELILSGLRAANEGCAGYKASFEDACEEIARLNTSLKKARAMLRLPAERETEPHLHSYEDGHPTDYVVGGTLVCGRCRAAILPDECTLLIRVPAYRAKIVVEEIQAGAASLMEQWGIDNPLSTQGSSD